MKLRWFAVSVAFVAFAPSLALAAQVNVSIGDNSFSPQTLTVNAGDTVVWTNNGNMAHTVTADNASFVSTTLQHGQTYSRVFTSAGSFPYYCQFHGGSGGTGMSGVINVAQPAAQSAATTGAATTVATTSSQAQSIAALQAQVQVLTQLLAQLQKKPAASAPSGAAPASACTAIVATLKLGSSGAGVTQLQQFLARDPSVYPEGKITGYYGALTQAAVKRFQAKSGIISSGTPSTTGYGQVGPKTAAAIVAQCGGGSAPDVPVGGFIQVSPDSGRAPLQINVQATVNTTNACGASVYTIDYGDGSTGPQIQVPAGACQTMQQTYTHTYTSAGTYSVTLAAGDHSSSAVVVVQ